MRPLRVGRGDHNLLVDNQTLSHFDRSVKERRMMSKRRIDTLAMFLLAGCIIFGGWFLTKSFLMRREVKYLNSIGQIAVQSSEITLFEESGQEDAVRQESGQQRAQEEEFHGVMMNEYERALVLSVWDYGGKELPHEPMNGQMNM